MLGLDRTAARWTWTAILILIAVRAVYEVRQTIFVLILSILFAYMLAPVVNILNRHLPGKSRTPGLAITYILLISVLSIVAIELGTTVVDEATSLAAQAPAFFTRLQSSGPDVHLPYYLRILKSNVFGRIQAFLQGHSSDIVSYLPAAGMKVLSLSGYLLYIVLVPIISFFLLKDASEFRASAAALLPDGPRRDLWLGILDDTHSLLGKYVRAVGLLCLNTFVVFAIFFSIMGVPYGILLAAIAFPLEFIPMIGPLVAAILILIVAVATGFNHLIAIVVFLGIYRMFQDYILSPRLMSAGVEVHPLLVILGVLAGEKLGGVPGMFLSVPAIALLRVAYRRMHATITKSSRVQLR